MISAKLFKNIEEVRSEVEKFPLGTDVFVALPKETVDQIRESYEQKGITLYEFKKWYIAKGRIHGIMYGEFKGGLAVFYEINSTTDVNYNFSRNSYVFKTKKEIKSFLRYV